MFSNSQGFARTLAAFLAALSFLGSPQRATAALLVYEPFAYPPGTPLPAMALGTGWAVPWIGSNQMISMGSSLTYPAAKPPLGRALVNNSVGEAFRSLGPPVNNLGSDLWISFMERSSAAGASTWVALNPLTASLPWFGFNKDGLGQVYLLIGGGPILIGSSAGPGNVDFFILHIVQFGGGFTNVEVYLNPPIMPAPANIAFSIPSPWDLREFYFRSDAGEWLDEIRVGTELGDVAAGAGCPGDVNGDNAVDLSDLAVLLAHFGTADGASVGQGDLNGDGAVDLNDLALLLANFGRIC